MKPRSTFLVLVLLTALSVLFAEKMPDRQLLPLVVLGLAMLKVMLVLFQFMEIRHAHPAWKAGLAGFTILLTGTLIATMP
mgnify:CR=1 FL=1